MAGYTGGRRDRKGMAGWHDAIFGQRVGWNNQCMTIHTADALLDVDIFQIGPHILFMAIEAHIVSIFEQGLLAMRVMADPCSLRRLCRDLSDATH